MDRLGEWAILFFMVRLALSCLAVIALLASGGARADQQDPRLDGLFSALQDTTDRATAREIEAEIWQIWLASGDEAIDNLMVQGGRAMQIGALDVALQRFNQIIATRPEVAEGWNKRATVYYMMGQYDLSISDIGSVLAREPRHFGALFGLGLCYLGLGDKARALDAFSRTLAVHPHVEAAKEQVRRLSVEVHGHET